MAVDNTRDPDWFAKVDLMFERLRRHAGETGREQESALEVLDRVLLDHEKLQHGAE